MTARMLAAMDNPHLTIIGHPTGRLLLSRDPYGARPRRGDREGGGHRGRAGDQRRSPPARPRLAGAPAGARRRASMISIGADAHNVAGIANVEYGVAMARKGWLGRRRRPQRAAGGRLPRLRPRAPSVSPRGESAGRRLRRGDAGAGRTGPAARADAPEILLRRLKRRYPDARCALDHRNAFELLCATILSAQCTDARVNMVTPTLFARYPTPRRSRRRAPRTSRRSSRPPASSGTRPGA